MNDPFMEAVRVMRQRRKKVFKGLYRSLLPGNDKQSPWKSNKIMKRRPHA